MAVSVKAFPPIKRVALVGNSLGTSLLISLCAARDFRKWSEPEVFGFSGGLQKRDSCGPDGLLARRSKNCDVQAGM
jgi:hypothetical protein